MRFDLGESCLATNRSVGRGIIADNPPYSLFTIIKGGRFGMHKKNSIWSIRNASLWPIRNARKNPIRSVRNASLRPIRKAKNPKFPQTSIPMGANMFFAHSECAAKSRAEWESLYFVSYLFISYRLDDRIGGDEQNWTGKGGRRENWDAIHVPGNRRSEIIAILETCRPINDARKRRDVGAFQQKPSIRGWKRSIFKQCIRSKQLPLYAYMG